MKHQLILAVLGFGYGLSAAVPQISNVGMARKQADGAVSIAYQLSGAPAVVTMAFSSEGTSLGSGAQLAVTGDVNVLVQPGAHTAVLPSLPVGVDGSKLAVQVRAWATNCPPDYLVLCLTNVNEKAHYYLSADEVPGGVTAQQYKTSHLVMRKIPAANVEWRMGSPAQEAEHAASYVRSNTREYSSGENLHYVRLTEDYYLGIYPVTYRQHCWATGSAGGTYGYWGDATFADVRRDDWPYAPTQYVSLRSWMHDNDKGCDGLHEDGTTCVYIHRWPRDGRTIDAAGSLKCLKSTGTYTPYLRSWRDKFGFEFDLPTDAQWEFACRAGTLGALYNDTDRADYTAVSSQEKLDEIAWNLNNSMDETVQMRTVKPVGLKQPNAWGLYDMIGNVWEWCLDVTHAPDLSGEAVVDPTGPDGINTRARRCILRGGSFCSPIGMCRSATRMASSVPSLNSNSFSDDTIDEKKSSSWQYGYRLWLPAQAAR